MFRINKNKYCCSWFSILYQQPDTSDCIRVIKITSFSPKLLLVNYAVGDTGSTRFVENSNLPYRFFLMPPAHPSNIREYYQKGISGYMLSFCPFCGTNLYTFYVKKRNIDDYVNEIEGKTF